MSEPPPIPAPPRAAPAPSADKALHKLFLTLFLRGRSSRGLRKQGAPQSIGAKLGLVLLLYTGVGLISLAFIHQPVFVLSLYLHAMTLVFLGMFVAASSGELLFNKEEADILLHRPVTSKALLWAKIGVLVRVSLWLAGAFNLAGLFVGITSSDGGWLYPIAHALSTVLEALFCAGSVVVVYQLCLRWFGRERLDGLMTMAQVVVAVVAVMAGQIPQLIGHFSGKFTFSYHAWWVYLLPPAWFAGLDDLIAGSRPAISAILALVGVLATGAVLWLAFEKLAHDYETGLQNLGEAAAPKHRGGPRRRWLDTMAGRPPLRWWLRDPVSRASFLLVAAYLFRDRDVKLRVYPGLAPMLAWPVIMLRLYDGLHRNLYRHHPAARPGFAALLATMAGGRSVSRRSHPRAGSVVRRRAAGCVAHLDTSFARRAGPAGPAFRQRQLPSSAPPSGAFGHGGNPGLELWLVPMAAVDRSHSRHRIILFHAGLGEIRALDLAGVGTPARMTFRAAILPESLIFVKILPRISRITRRQPLLPGSIPCP